ncbi:MAG: hypothetical protein JKP95_01025 [Oceanicaulis sp.]|nr:hypothetical protein [Oceanicaulis sp.]
MLRARPDWKPTSPLPCGRRIVPAPQCAQPGRGAGLSERFQSAAPNAWLAIDQEGGFVQRLTDEMGFTDIPTAEALAEMGLDAARPVFAQAARELAQSAFSMNLAPVADLRHEGNQVIDRWARAFGDDPDTWRHSAAPSSKRWKRKASPAPSSIFMGAAKATAMTGLWTFHRLGVSGGRAL